MEILLQKNVKFILKDVEDGWNTHLDDSDWEDVILPHDWAVSRSFSKEYSSGTGYLPGGTGWYRIPFELPAEAENCDITLCFGGVYKHARVWCNQYYLGDWANGYTPFDINISHAVRFGQKNLIAVQVNHNDTADSRWYTGSGIEREVKLLIQPKVHEVVKERVFRVKSIDENRAVIETEHVLVNKKETGSPYRITEFVAGSRMVSSEGSIEAGGTVKVSFEYELKDLPIWSVDEPNLHEWKTLVESGNDRDINQCKVGILKTFFDPDKGFFCNNVPMKLKGVCLHEDAGSFGNAVPKNVWKRRLSKLKEMGANTVRMSHNPHSECLYELCDEMGFFVIDEIFDEWEGPKNKWWQGHNVYPPKHQGYFLDYPTWHERDVEAFVKARRNHAAVIMWSIGNEIDYPNDPYCHESFGEMTGNNDAGKPSREKQYDPEKPNAIRLVTLAKELTRLVKKYDETRPVSLASAFPELSGNTGLFNCLDVIGYNYKEQFYEADHKRFPDKPIFGSENGHDYKQWLAVTENDYISGQCLWTGIDYLGETRGWPEHGSRAGHLTTAGFEKPDFYFRKSLWNEKEKFVKLATCKKDAPGWMELRRFSWKYEAGEEVRVEAYTGLSEVELFVNDRPVGRTERDETGKFVWILPFEEGVIKAVARDKEGSVYEDILETDNEGATVTAKLLDEPFAPEPAFGAYEQIEVTVLDPEGRIARNAEIPVTVRTEGQVSFVHMDNGNLADISDYVSNVRNTHGGRLMVYVRRGERKGNSAVILESPLGDVRVDL
ncbi:MAG: DUF4982 domain-containing protein [Lachnospiraceae bacterium]|nr:DUF4982 domain-containing protein [Lachnospiraceae bacterium]